MAVGAAATPGIPGSRSRSRRVMRPTSLKIVERLLTTVRTSDAIVLPNAPGAAPEAPSSATITSCEGERLSCTSSPHTVTLTAAAATASIPTIVLPITHSRSLLLEPHDPGREEDQQLPALVGDAVSLEQPAEQRDPVETRRPLLIRLFAAHVDAADDGRVAVAHEHLRDGALRVDRRDVVDRPAEVGRRVLDRDAHDHRIGRGDLRLDLERQRGVLERDGHRVVRHGLDGNLHALCDFRLDVVL